MFRRQEKTSGIKSEAAELKIFESMADRIFELIILYGEIGFFPEEKIAKMRTEEKKQIGDAAPIYLQHYENGFWKEKDIGRLSGDEIILNYGRLIYKKQDFDQCKKTLAGVLQKNIACPAYTKTSEANQFNIQCLMAITLLKASFRYPNIYIPDVNGIVSQHFYIGTGLFGAQYLNANYFPAGLFHLVHELVDVLRPAFLEIDKLLKQEVVPLEYPLATANDTLVNDVMTAFMNCINLERQSEKYDEMIRKKSVEIKFKSPYQAQNLRTALSLQLRPETGTMLEEKEKNMLIERLVALLHEAVDKHKQTDKTNVSAISGYEFSIKGKNILYCQLPALLFDSQARLYDVLNSECEALRKRVEYQKFKRLLLIKTAPDSHLTFFGRVPADIGRMLLTLYYADPAPKISEVLTGDEKGYAPPKSNVSPAQP